MREILPTPPQMIDEQGQPHFGVFRSPFRVVNPIDADIYDNGNRTPRWFKNLRLKEWQHFGIVHEDFYLGFVVFDAKYMGTTFAYCFDRQSGQLFQHDRRTPGRSPVLPQSLWRGSGYVRLPGYKIEIENCLEEGYHKAQLDIAADGEMPAFQAELTMHEDLDQIQPMIAVLPAGPKRPFYTHKVSTPASGFVVIGERRWELNSEAHAVLFDVQKTYYPYRFHWLWATFTGQDQAGNRIAANLSKNPVTDHETLNQNCVWINGKISLLGRVRFDYDPADVLQPWRMTTADGRLDLTFTPQGERSHSINALIIGSAFHQPFGKYEGSVIDDDGKRYEIAAAFGVAEDHMMRS